MCKLRRCLANTRPWQRAAFVAVALVCAAVLVDLWRAEEYRRVEENRAGTLVLQLRVEPGKPQPRIQVEVFSDDPATEHHEVSAFRRLYAGIREQFVKQESRWISVHHDVEKIRALRTVESEWIEPGEKRVMRLKPGRYLLSREIWWGREAGYVHSGFQYRTVEIKPGEVIEIDDLLDGWTR